MSERQAITWTKSMGSSAALMQQVAASHELMTRFHDYAESIDCRMYDNSLYDSIEVFTEEQTRLLKDWWNKNAPG